MKDEKPKKFSDKAVEVKSSHKHSKEKSDLKIWKNIAGVIGFVVLLILIYVVVKESMPQTQSYEVYSYNGFDFTGNGILWATQIYDSATQTSYSIQLHNGPRDVEYVPIKGDVNDLLKRASGFYLTFDPNENESMNYVALSAYELTSNYESVYGRIIKPACIVNETDACINVSIVDCSDPKVPAIYLKAEGEPKVYVDGPCIYVQGEGEGLVKAANRLLYQWYGIMK